jgi:hypothetical protein
MKEKLFSRDEGFTLSSMPDGPAHMLNRLECQADFTYRMGPKTIKIEDTGKGPKPVGEDLEAVLRKIEGWHQGSISGFFIGYRDRDGVWHDIPSRRQGSDSRKKFRSNLKPVKRISLSS